MLKIKSIELGADYRHGYGKGARPGVKCEVEFQNGDRSYDTVKILLPDEAVRRVTDVIVAEAVALITASITASPLDLNGVPGEPRAVEQAEMPVDRAVNELAAA